MPDISAARAIHSSRMQIETPQEPIFATFGKIVLHHRVFLLAATARYLHARATNASGVGDGWPSLSRGRHWLGRYAQIVRRADGEEEDMQFVSW